MQGAAGNIRPLLLEEAERYVAETEAALDAYHEEQHSAETNNTGAIDEAAATQRSCAMVTDWCAEFRAGIAAQKAALLA